MIDGKTYEPMEHVVIDVPTQYQGAVMTGLGQRKAILQQMESLGTDRVRLEFRMPSRGLFGYRNQFLTDTHGEGIINQIFDGYDVWAGMIANRSTGSLVSFRPARPSPTACSTLSSAAPCWLAPARRCTRAWSSATPLPARMWT